MMGYKSAKSAERKPRNPYADSPGGFLPSGSWDEHGNSQSLLTRFVRSMVIRRRTTGLTPAELVERMPRPDLLRCAFPHLDECLISWERCQDWGTLRCSTSAESAVCYPFRSADGYAYSHAMRDDPERAVQTALEAF